MQPYYANTYLSIIGGFGLSASRPDDSVGRVIHPTVSQFGFYSFYVILNEGKKFLFVRVLFNS